MAPFVDPAFPPNETSLGELGIFKTGHINAKSIEWVRVTQLCGGGKNESVELFLDGASPDDITQGSVGNCWLLSAFACVARIAPHIIEERFVSPLDPDTGKPTISKEGRYVVQLWDVHTEKWENIVIDDFIPCVKGGDGSLSPLSASPKGNEAWVLLLEKAFARYMSSYAAMEGGLQASAFKALAGDGEKGLLLYMTDSPGNDWDVGRPVLLPTGKASNGLPLRQMKVLQAGDAKAESSIKLFHKLRTWLKDEEHTYIIGGGTAGSNDKVENDGIYMGHAYSVVGIAFPEGFTMIKLANPHGCGEWRGPWCDGSELWNEHPEVAKLCGYDPNSVKDDGVFWMQLQSFEKLYDCVMILRLPKIEGQTLKAEEAAEEEDEYEDEDEGGEWEDYEWEEEEAEDEEEDEEEDGEEDEEEEDPETVFETFDDDGSGFLNTFEMAFALQSITGERPSKQVVAHLMKVVGASGKKGVNLEQFKAVCLLLPWMDRFNEWDEEGAGELDHDTVVELLKAYSDEQVEAATDKASKKMAKSMQKEIMAIAKKLVKEFDKDGSESMTLDEFLAMIIKAEGIM